MRRIDVDRVQHRLRHLPVVRAYRSHGSMIHLHFGELYERRSRSGTYKWGDYYLMVELAEWEIFRHVRLLVSSSDDRKKIDREIVRFIGAKIKLAVLAYAGTTIIFEGGLKLAMRPDPSAYGSWGMSNWTLFRRGEVVFAADYDKCQLR